MSMLSKLFVMGVYGPAMIAGSMQVAARAQEPVQLPAPSAPLLDATEQSRQLYRETRKIDESRLERFTLVVPAPTGARGYDAVFEGPKGFLDAIAPCRREAFRSMTRRAISMPHGDVDEIRVRTTADQVAPFAQCVSEHAGLTGS